MTSARKCFTNRMNSCASTGPKTATGRAHSAQNARQHGLSLPVLSDPLWSRNVEALALELAGEGANAEILRRARTAAEAVIEVQRVRSARHQLLFEAMSGRWDMQPSRRAKDRAVRARTAGPFMPIPDEIAESVHSRQQERAEKFALILESRFDQMSRLDRYERRALSKRRFALRAFDQARRAAAGREAGGGGLARDWIEAEASYTIIGHRTDRFSRNGWV